MQCSIRLNKIIKKHHANDICTLKLQAKLKTLVGEGLPEPEFYGDLVYKFMKLIRRNDLLFSSEQSLHVTYVSVII